VNPRNLSRGLRLSAGGLLALLTVALVMMRELPYAFLSATGAWYLLVGSAPPWHRAPPSSSGGGAGSGSGGGGGQSRLGQLRVGSMSRAEALKVLGLEEGAGEDKIRASHKKLILQLHPDKGGTNYLAAKINEAKDVLLRRG
jgi:hypothetical protein